MDIRIKKHLISQNIYCCKFGMYKTLPIAKTQKNFFSYNLNIAPPYEYCTVEVKPTHILDTAYEYVRHGYKPAILNLVTSDFTGGNINSSEGFRDELIFIRTNINQTITGFNLFPLKGTEVAYAPIVHIIRNDNMQPLHPSQIYKLSVITASLKQDPLLISETINLDDYTSTSQLLETIFQTAHLGGNDVLILNDYGCISDNYPVADVIEIINGFIYKYGHLFKHVVISIYVATQADMGYYSKISDNIVRPQSFLNEYMQTNLISNQNQNQNINLDLQYPNPETLNAVNHIDNQMNTMMNMNPVNQNQINLMNQNQINQMANLNMVDQIQHIQNVNNYVPNLNFLS